MNSRIPRPLIFALLALSFCSFGFSFWMENKHLTWLQDHPIMTNLISGVVGFSTAFLVVAVGFEWFSNRHFLGKYENVIRNRMSEACSHLDSLTRLWPSKNRLWPNKSDKSYIEHHPACMYHPRSNRSPRVNNIRGIEDVKFHISWILRSVDAIREVIRDEPKRCAILLEEATARFVELQQRDNADTNDALDAVIALNQLLNCLHESRDVEFSLSPHGA